jgi:hypothetical protein
VQVLLLLNGMIGRVFICSLRHNDNSVQTLSGLNGHLVNLLHPLCQVNNQRIYPAVFGDAIFTPLATITHPYLNPNEEQRIVNARFSSLREDIEHKFAQVFGLCQVLLCLMETSTLFQWRPCAKAILCLFVHE